MITVKQIPHIPDLPYTGYSAEELTIARQYLPEIERSSAYMWIGLNGDDPLFVVGVQQPSFLSIPRLWFLLCEGLVEGKPRLRGVRKAMWQLDEKYSRLETLVEKGWTTGQRFARFFNFRPSPRTEEILGRTFVVMER